jgi:hypothetical protein
MVAIGIPVTNTRRLGTVGMANPPCWHITTAPLCKIGPAMVRSP